MDRERYPENWEQISREVRARSMGKCECAGECGTHSGSCRALHRQAHPRTGSTVILTVAHLWRGPCREHHEAGIKCGDPAHLKAMCQACHLGYDRPDHIAKRRATAFNARALGDLFDDAE